MPEGIHTGVKGFSSVTVNTKNTALSMGSGELDVFATPAMAALMEKACANSVATFLGIESTTVGTELNIAHKSASIIGEQVRCDSEIIAINGKKLLFKVVAFDQEGVIGDGTHTRVIVDRVRFMERATAKRKDESNG